MDECSSIGVTWNGGFFYTSDISSCIPLNLYSLKANNSQLTRLLEPVPFLRGGGHRILHGPLQEREESDLAPNTLIVVEINLSCTIIHQ